MSGLGFGIKHKNQERAWSRAGRPWPAMRCS